MLALCDEQGGFRKERSTSNQIFILSKLITYRLEVKLDTYTCFIDIPQGSILSQLIYAHYIDGLRAELAQAGIGIRMSGAVTALRGRHLLACG